MTSVYNPALAGLRNVNYTDDQLLQMGDNWKKAVKKANSPVRNDTLSIIPQAVDFAGSVYNGFQYNKTADDLSADYGYGQSSAMGVGYTTQNVADARQVMKEEHAGNVSNAIGNVGKGAALGATVGSIIPGLGTVAGGIVGGAIGGVASLFGGGRRHAQARKQLALQQQQATRTNNYNRDIAMTTGIQQEFAKKYGNPEDQILLTKYGKDSRKGTFALTQPGEVKATEDGKLIPYLGGVKGKDSILDFVGDNETIFTKLNGHASRMLALYSNINKNKGRNLEIAERASKATIEKEKQAQKKERELGLIPQEQVARAKWGLDQIINTVSTLGGMGTAFGQYLQAKASKVHKPDIRVQNPYELSALRDLYSLRPDNLAINRQLRDAEARGRYQLNSAGGLTAGQRALANVALTSNTQRNIADMLAQSQDRFNTLRANAASAAFNAGNATATRNQQALQYNDAAYQQSASARQNIMRDSIAQIPSMLQQWYKNYDTGLRGNRMLAMYEASLDDDARKYYNKKYGTLT